MRSYLITVFCLGVRYQYTTQAPGTCDAIVAAMSAYPQSDVVRARRITLQ